MAGLLIFSGLAGAATTPDQYDSYCNDDTSKTTRNYLEPGVVQNHNLDTAADQDWIKLIVPKPGFKYNVVVGVPAKSQIDVVIWVLDKNNHTISMDPFSGDPGLYDSKGEGFGETCPVTLDNSGPYRIRVSTAAAKDWGANNSYTIQVTGGPGDTAGLGTISMKSMGPSGGVISKIGGIGAPKAGTLPVDGNLYPYRKVFFAGGETPSLAADQEVTLCYALDAYDAVKKYEATQSWFARELASHNYSITMLLLAGVGSAPGIVNFPTPIKLTLNLAGPVTLPDGDITVNDVPAGYRSDQARVMVWKPSVKAWVEFDPAPARNADGSFTTSISSIADFVCTGSDELNFNQTFFALEPLEQTAARDWSLYQ